MIYEESPCNNCGSVTHFNPNEKGYGYFVKNNMIVIALKHEKTCKEYLSCMSCGGDAITGIYGLCFQCLKDKE